MPQPKKYDSQVDQIEAWKAANTDKVQLSLRKDSDISKPVLAAVVTAYKAKTGQDFSITKLLTEGARMWIDANMGADWLEKNGNKGE